MIDTIIAGDTLAFTTGVTDTDGTSYPPSAGWSMLLRLVPLTAGTPIEIPATASADDSEFLIAVSSTTTAAWAAADYSAFAMVTLAGERKTVYMGTVTIRSNPATATTYDVRSAARQALDAARSLWFAHASNRVQVLEYEIAGRKMRFVSADQLVKHIKALELEVANEERAERIATGMGSGRKILTRFAS